jgi:hypothetical protein
VWVCSGWVAGAAGGGAQAAGQRQVLAAPVGVTPTYRNHPLTLTFSVRTRSTKAEPSSASRWEPWKRQLLPCEASGRAIIEICRPSVRRGGAGSTAINSNF